MHPELNLMQDGAPGHSAQSTIQELAERGIQAVCLPPYSPDLNPIETVWNWMKDWIDGHYDNKLNYDQLRAAVKDAWEALPDRILNDLIDEMPKRCEAVIKANGHQTMY